MPFATKQEVIKQQNYPRHVSEPEVSWPSTEDGRWQRKEAAEKKARTQLVPTASHRGLE
jgi:hypothetical protein